MKGLLLIVYASSLSVCCLTLGLSIANAIFHKAHWCRWYVVFQACVLFTIALSFMCSVSTSFFSAKLNTVLNYTFRIMAHATVGFVIVLLPYFLKWIIGLKWGAGQREFFYPLGIIYFASGLIAEILQNNFIAQIVQTPVFVLVLIYCMFVLYKNLVKIEDKKSRDICFTIIVVTMSLIPLGILSVIFSMVDKFSYPVYALAISIIMLVYFFNRFNVDSEKLHRKSEVNKNELGQYKITDREMVVVSLICDGLTNKEIAGKLKISVNTVNNHVANIFEKLGARSRVDLMRMLKVGPWD